MMIRDNMIEINFSVIFNILKRHIAIIAITTLFGALIGFGVSKFVMIPQYEASVNMIVNTRADTATTVTNDNITSAKNLVNTYAVIIKSNTVLNQVIKNLNLDITYKELAEKVDVSAVNSTQVMRISARDTSIEVAKEIIDQITLIAPKAIEDAVAAGYCTVVSEVEAEPCSPNIRRNVLLFAFIAMVSSMTVVILKSLIRKYIEDDVDVRRYLDLPLIGVIPEVESDRLLLVTNKNDLFVFVEAYKALRTHLKYISKAKGCSSFVVTSAAPEECKSSTVINLGISLAQEGKRVIVVDCDLRKPILHKYMKINRNKRGLTNILMGDEKLEDCIKYFQDINLSVLFSGTASLNPTELLSSETMVEILNILKDEYDYVILDAPPILVVTDAAILGSMVDGALMVVRSNFVPPVVAALAKQKLEEVGVINYGVILTRFNIKKSSKESGYSYTYGYEYKK